jgi:hypothetical protein
MGKLSEKVVKILLSKIKEQVVAGRDNKKWVTLFVDAGAFFITDEEKATAFYTDLEAVFSEENMKKMAESLKEKSGFQFRQVLKEKLQKLMADYEIDMDTAETYTNHFMQIILAYLEQHMPEEYTRDFLQEWKNEENEQFRILQERLKRMEEAIQKLGNGKKAVFSMAQINEKLRKETISPRIGLDFFEIDDEEFLNAFHENIQEERLYIVGKSREETIYCILNEIRKMNLQRIVLVVTDDTQWQQLEQDGIRDAILIPWFFAGTIPTIAGNTNLFIFGEDEPCYTPNRINLRRRTKRNLVHSLERAGLSLDRASELVESTHGLYVPLKKKMYNGAFYTKPAWCNCSKKVFVTALLCGKWTESDGDKLIIEELSGMSYETFMEELTPFMQGGDPFAVRVNTFGEESIQITCVENAWEELDAEITKDVWEKFVNLFYEVMVEQEPIFALPFEKHFTASLYTEKPYWSPALKRGMIRSLTMRAYYRGHNENQYQVNTVIDKVLSSVTDSRKWGYIAQYFMDLCEAAPEIILHKLETELQQPTGMEEMFAAKDGGAMEGRHYYTNVLWAVEELLLQKKYAERAVRWLWEMDAQNIQYSISNSPRNILETIFCAWINVCVLSADEKIKLAEWAAEHFEHAWDILYDELPGRKNAISSTLNRPSYRTVDEPPMLYNGDVNNTYLAYVRICLAHMEALPDRWTKLIENADCYYDELLEEVFTQLTAELQQMDDEGKIQVKNKIRTEIYRHRYFKNAEWAMPENKIIKYEEMMNQIHTTDSVYEYLYLFNGKYDFPLQHPIPFGSEKENETNRVQNEKMREREIEQGIQKFENNGLSLKRLLELGTEIKNSTIGESVAQYYGDRKFHMEVLDMMLELPDQNTAAYKYVRYFVVQNNMEPDAVVSHIQNQDNREDFLIQLLQLEIITADKEPLIARQSETIKKKYWQGIYRISVKADAKAYRWALGECRKYGVTKNYLELLFDAKELLSADEIYEWFVQVLDVEIGENKVMDTMTAYYLEELLQYVQEHFMQDAEKCSQIADIEWAYGNCIAWKRMQCVQRMMKSSPVIYAQMSDIIYLKEGESKEDRNNTEDEKQKAASRLFDFFHKAQFCPAEQDGTVEYESLRKWVDEFRILLEKQKQSRLFGHLVGRLLPYAPQDEDGTKPCKAVRRLIEEIYDDSLKNAYVTAEINKRGVYTPDAGKSEMEMALRYQENADRIRGESYHTAMIYETLSENYMADAALERKHAEDEW